MCSGMSLFFFFFLKGQFTSLFNFCFGFVAVRRLSAVEEEPRPCISVGRVALGTFAMRLSTLWDCTMNTPARTGISTSLCSGRASCRVNIRASVSLCPLLISVLLQMGSAGDQLIPPRPEVKQSVTHSMLKIKS